MYCHVEKPVRKVEKGTTTFKRDIAYQTTVQRTEKMNFLAKLAMWNVISREYELNKISLISRIFFKLSETPV